MVNKSLPTEGGSPGVPRGVTYTPGAWTRPGSGDAMLCGPLTGGGGCSSPAV